MRERITEALIRQESFDDVYERGERLYEAEEVWDLAWRGDRLEAKVSGNSAPSYLKCQKKTPVRAEGLAVR
mgnify:CR=1 FL=1